MSREDILLKEYELSQKSVDSASSLYWIVAGTFIAINTALLGGVAYNIAFKGISSDKGINWLALLLGVTLSVEMISILICLLDYMKRINFKIRVKYVRMREIEDELGMWMGWRIYALDEWHNNKWSNRSAISPSMREKLLSYRPIEYWQSWEEKHMYTPTIGASSVIRIFNILIRLWLFMVLIMGLLLVAPFIQKVFSWIIQSW